MALAEDLGMGVIVRKADAAVAKLPKKVVYAGVLAGFGRRTIPGPDPQGCAWGVAVPRGTDPKWFSKPWPPGLPVQIHFAAGRPVDRT